ncbi:NBR1-Ig-like domain-containing protein [Undibacterium sp. Di27W]|uniref:NBR1-Ig-like domain-containing protein n=1 Tax=Undibacterium sp. Di27W TaxID=3413036 RepID=UPI003BF34677
MNSTIHPIRKAIDQACKQHKITHTYLCARADISRETLYRVLRGEVERATVTTIYKIARAAKIAPISLLRLVYDDIDLGPGIFVQTKYSGDIPSFINDETFPDGSTVYVNARFTKIWNFQNTGSVPWINRRLKRVDEELALCRRNSAGQYEPVAKSYLESESNEVLIADTLPGMTVAIAVNFRAPNLPCDVISTWKMIDAEGNLCFPEYSGAWVKISVVAI